MKAYELMLMLTPDLDEERRAEVIKKVEDLIAAQAGVVDNVDSWGKRKLAYEIGGLTDGDYVVVDFHAEPAAIAEIDRVLRISDPVVRFMVVVREDRD